MEDTREQYSEMRDEFFASLEDRRYLSIAEARKKRLQVRHKSRGSETAEEDDPCSLNNQRKYGAVWVILILALAKVACTGA